MRVPNLDSERQLAWTLVVVLVGLIAGRLVMAEYGMQGPVFRGMLILIYLVMVLLVFIGIRHVWRSREVLRPDR